MKICAEEPVSTIDRFLDVARNGSMSHASSAAWSSTNHSTINNFSHLKNQNQTNANS